MNIKVSAHEAILKAASKDKEAALAEDPTQPDLSVDLGEHKLFYEVETLKHKLKEVQEIHRLRLNYSGLIFNLLLVWLFFVGLLLLAVGFQYKNFYLSDKVLITLLTTTTINVLGLFLVVAKWMFPRN